MLRGLSAGSRPVCDPPSSMHGGETLSTEEAHLECEQNTNHDPRGRLSFLPAQSRDNVVKATFPTREEL